MIHYFALIHVRDGIIPRAFKPFRDVATVAATGVSVVIVAGANEEKSRGPSAANFEQYFLRFLSAETSVIPRVVLGREIVARVERRGEERATGGAASSVGFHGGARKGGTLRRAHGRRDWIG